MYTQKDRRPEIYQVGVLDIEKSQLPGVQEHPWQTDTCIGNWFYDAKQPYKHPDQIIEMLIDIVSKNGTMLLNVLQRPDGTIDDEAATFWRSWPPGSPSAARPFTAPAPGASLARAIPASPSTASPRTRQSGIPRTTASPRRTAPSTPS